MNLPLEIINKILIMRPTHPIAKIMEPYINHDNEGRWYFDKYHGDYKDFHLWFFAELNRNAYKCFKLNNYIIHYANRYNMYIEKDRIYTIDGETYNEMIKKSHYPDKLVFPNNNKVKQFINKIHHF
jgi:hypothetical protein